MKPVLEVKHISTSYKEGKQKQKVLEDVNFTLYENEILGLVGESGCGKTTLSKAILGFIKPEEGEIIHYTKNPQMVFQDPFSSLNPSKKIGWILEEPLRMQKIPKEIRRQRVEEMAEKTGLTKEHLKRRPKELSGGQRQRVSIALALLQGAGFIIADEPVSALDVTIQKQILELLNELRSQQGNSLSILFICHDISLVQQFCDRVLVMYHGSIVEEGTPDAVIGHPRNTYTKRLIDSVL